MNFIKKLFTTKNGLLNIVAIAAPIVAGVISGGVFTVPVLIAAAGSLAGKLAASPLNHDTAK